MPRTVKVLVACSLLVLLALGVQWETVPDQLASLDWRLAATGLALIAVEMIVNAWKWSYSLRLHDLRFPFGFLVRTCCFGYFFNNFLPSAIGGDVYRVYRTMAPGCERSRAVSAVLVERIVGLGAMLFIGAIGALLLVGTSTLARAYLVGAGLAALCMLVAAALWALTWFDGPRAVLGRVAWLEPVRANLRRALRPRPEWIGLVAASFVFQILAVAVVYFAFAAVGTEVSVAAAAIITVAAGIASVLPISISGLGVVEGSIAGTAVAFGVDYDSALLAALVVRLLAVVIGAGCGLLYLAERDAPATPGPPKPAT